MTPRWFRRDLAPGDSGSDVQHAQVRLGIAPTGTYDQSTAALVRGLQLVKGLPMTGEIDADTATELGDRATTGLTPEWYVREVELWTQGPDVRRVNDLLEQNEGDVFTPQLEAAILRVQSANGLPLTGHVDESTATILGD